MTDAQKREIDENYRQIAEGIAARVEAKDLPKVATWLTKMSKAAEQVVSFHEAFDTFPFDGAVAFFNAMQEKFGFVEHLARQSFFGSSPPPMIGVEIGPGETVQVPWGEFALPGYEELIISVGTHANKDGFHFCISGQVKTKDRDVVTQIATLIRKNLKEKSIYKGKAIRLHFDEDFDPETYSPDDVAPTFLDLSSISPDELILPASVKKMVQDSLFTPVEKTEMCRKFGIRIGRKALLAGTYGVGKTLTANVLAQKATQQPQPWTFIYLDNVRDLAHGLRMAKHYTPAIIFAEDIDAVMSGTERTDEMNEVLNSIDGIEIKGKEIMVVLTTNHVERINQAMIRPGRVDALIEVTPPDAKAAEQLLRVYGKSFIAATEDLSQVGKSLDGQRPASIAEVVERSKLSAITRLSPGEPLSITQEDLLSASESLKKHIELVDRKTVEERKKPKSNGVAHGESLAEA
jgi:transitional endoplasmic reticulum ATPase